MPSLIELKQKCLEIAEIVLEIDFYYSLVQSSIIEKPRKNRNIIKLFKELENHISENLLFYRYVKGVFKEEMDPERSVRSESYLEIISKKEQIRLNWLEVHVDDFYNFYNTIQEEFEMIRKIKVPGIENLKKLYKYKEFSYSITW